MNAYLAGAAALTVAIGLVHSVLGERLIFSRLRRGGAAPRPGGSPLPRAQLGILWATWHLVSVLGWAWAAVLLRLAAEPALGALPIALLHWIAVAMLASAALVLVGTRGRHPGWIALCGVAGLTWLGLPG